MQPKDHISLFLFTFWPFNTSGELYDSYEIKLSLIIKSKVIPYPPNLTLPSLSIKIFCGHKFCKIISFSWNSFIPKTNLINILQTNLEFK